MLYVAAAVERAMKIQEVICRALAGKLSWIEGAEILGCCTTRTSGSDPGPPSNAAATSNCAGAPTERATRRLT